MANYDIIGGVVSPKALEELKALEKIVDDIASKLGGMTIGTASAKGGDAGLKSTINKLEKEIERLNTAKKQGLSIDQKVDQQNQRLQQKYEAIANSSSKYVTELQRMEARMKLLNIELQKLVAAGQTESKAYLDKMAALQKLSTSYDLMAKASGVAQMRSTSMYGATFQLTQVMRELPNFAIDARIGFMSLSNNLPMLADSFKQLSQQIDATTGKAYGTVGALKIFAKSLLSANTILIIASTLLVLYGEKILNFIAQTSDAEKAQKKLTDELKKGNGIYIDATNELERLNAVVDSARKGNIDASDAVNEYNKSLGEHLGKVNSLNEVYEKLKKSGDDYIEVQFRLQVANAYLAQSQLLIGEAAALSANNTVSVWDIAGLRLQKVIKAIRFGISGLANIMSGNFKLAATDFAQFSDNLERGGEAEEILNKRNEKSNELREKAAKLLENYKVEMQDMYAFAKDKGIDMFPDVKAGNEVFDAYNKQIADLVRKLDELNQMTGSESATGEINSIEKRLAANELFYRTSLDLLEEQKKEEEEKAKGNAAELQRIDDAYYLKSLEAFRDYKAKQTSILNDAQKTIEDQVKAESKVFSDIHETAIDGWLAMMKKSREDNLKDAIDKAKQEIQIEKEKEQLRKDLLRDSITGAMELVNSLNDLYIKKLEEQGERMSQIEQAKLDEIKLKEEAGLLTKIESENEKARITDYYASVQAELDRKKEAADKRSFLLKQAVALGEVWVNFAMASASLENLLAAGAFTPLYLGLALASTGIIAAQTIPAFAEGGEMKYSGNALLGDGGKNELAILPDGRMFITPDVPTIYDIPKGTEILPDVNAIDMQSLIAKTKIVQILGNDNKDMILELRDMKKAIKNQKSGNFYGMPLIKQIGMSERFYYRKQSLRN